MGEICQQRGSPSVLIDRVADMAVEVAIGAFGDAERPVDVEGEVAHLPSAATSKLNASARWLMACFSAGSISPNVRSILAATNIAS